MNRTICLRELADVRGLTLACAAVLFAFQWLAVWMAMLLQGEEFLRFFMSLPSWMQGLIPVEARTMATPPGMIAMAYVDPTVLLTLSVFAIARGSDIVSGRLDRGTMEMLLAQPIRRITLFGTHAGVTIAAAAVLAASCWLGTVVGLMFVGFDQPVSARPLLGSAVNLLTFTFFLAALTSLFSACQRYRSQTIAWVGGIFVVQLIQKVVSRAGELQWITYTTFFGAFEPATIATGPGDPLVLSLQYNGVFLAMGLACYVAAVAIFCRRDLPAPL